MWSHFLVCFLVVLSTNAFSKYGRTCKDIGCLNSEVCILAEDPCSIGRSSNCGSYPTCKKKTAADSGGDNNQLPPTKATTPKPIAELRPAQPPPRYDDIPNYPPPAPPRGSSFGSNSNGGSIFGNNNRGGGSSGGSNSDSFPNPFSAFGFGSNTGGNSGGTNGNPLTSILSNILSNFTKGGLLPALNPSFTRPGLIENRNSNPSNPSNPYGNPSNPYGNPSNPYANPSNPYGNPSNPYGNPSYPGYNPYQRPGSYNPSYNQPNAQAQPSLQSGYVAKNYAQSNSGSVRNAATTRRPISYGWNFGISCVFIVLTRLIFTNYL